MQNFVIKELSGINFDEKVKSMVAFLGSKSDLSLIFIGVGKTAHVAKRLTASFVSMNVRCKYLHAADALHGDMGIIDAKDHCILLSYSGETAEVIDLARHLSNLNCMVLSVTNRSGSSLEALSDHSIFLNCSNGLPGFEKIPSVSLYAMEILFDLFLIDYCKRNNKSMIDFSYNHPSGGIGAWFASPVKKIARDLSTISIEFNASLDNISKQMDKLETGIVCILLNQEFVGCLSSGDVRRLGAKHISDIELVDLNKTPIQVSDESSIQVAIEVMKQEDINILFLTNSQSEISGYVTLGDLIK